MRAQKLKLDRLNEFIDYCKRHRLDHDGSWLSDDDLENFILNEDNPTSILVDDSNEIIGAVSLMLGSGFRESKKSRFRILHSVKTELEVYSLLINSIMSYLLDIDRIYLFIPEAKDEIRKILESLGFHIERYSWVLKKSTEETTEPVFPKEYLVKPLRLGKDEEVWVEIHSRCFIDTPGFTSMTSEEVTQSQDSKYYLENGMILLWNNDRPVGIVNVSIDEDSEGKDAYIGPIAILPELQGLGLGRNLLRAGLQSARKAGFKNVWLSVSAENQRAAKLYLDEGFEKVQVVICYNKNLK